MSHPPSLPDAVPGANRATPVPLADALADADPAHAAPHPPRPRAPGWRGRLGEWIESTRVQYVIVAIIVLNAVVLGLQTMAGVRRATGELLPIVDALCLAVFVVELLVKLVAFGPRFFRSGWNIFDLLVVGIALVPAAGPFAVLRALRVLRVLRLVSVIPKLRFIVSTLLAAVPGIASIGALLCIVFYVSAVMATELFGASFPEWFGSIGASLFSLFQIMTLDSWSTGVVRPVMAVYPWAWAFFVPFILVSAFTVLNLFIAVIVDSMQTVQAARGDRDRAAGERGGESGGGGAGRGVTDARAGVGATACDEPDAGGGSVSVDNGGSVAGGDGGTGGEDVRGDADAALLAELARVRAQLDALTAAVERRG